jgi:hypothetical protein
MDPHSFAGALLALDAIRTDRRPSHTETPEDAYYRHHTPVERRIPRAFPVIAGLCLGFVAASLLLQ